MLLATRCLNLEAAERHRAMEDWGHVRAHLSKCCTLKLNLWSALSCRLCLLGHCGANVSRAVLRDLAQTYDADPNPDSSHPRAAQQSLPRRAS